MGMEDIRAEAERVGLRHNRASTRYQLTLTEQVWDEDNQAFVTRDMVSMCGSDRHISGVCRSIIEELTEDYAVDARPAEKVTTLEIRQRVQP